MAAVKACPLILAALQNALVATSRSMRDTDAVLGIVGCWRESCQLWFWCGQKEPRCPHCGKLGDGPCQECVDFYVEQDQRYFDHMAEVEAENESRRAALPWWRRWLS